VGNGAGKISQQEANQISSGDLLEIRFDFTDIPTAPLSDRQALLSTLGQRAIDEFIGTPGQPGLFAQRFRLYGYTQDF
jgi:hypothetical protein